MPSRLPGVVEWRTARSGPSMGGQKELTNPDDGDGPIDGHTALILLEAEKVTT